MKALMVKLKSLLAVGGTKKDIALLSIAGVSLLFSLFQRVALLFDTAWVAIALCGIPIIFEAIIGLVTEFDITADVLVAIALIASVAVGETFAAGEVAFIMQLGGLLEELTVARARSGIEKLVHLTPRTARVIKDGAETIVPAQAVCIGDRLSVHPGETIAVDGVIRSGQTAVNQAVMTGESLPVDKGVGDAVFSGTVNQYGAFEMEATEVGEDSSIQRMIRLVQSADAGKAKIVNLADRWAVWIVLIALSTAVGTWVVTRDIIRAVTILVVFCPCALVLATPTAITAGIGNVTKHGFLVREGDALERLARVSRITFDKTGTLTLGTPAVTAVAAEGDRDALYRLTAAAEQFSEHPLGEAVVRCYQESHDQPLPSADQFKMIPGQGVFAEVDGHRVLAGNSKLFEAEGIPLPEHALGEAIVYQNDGSTVTYVAVDGHYAGTIVLADTLRPKSLSMIERLKHLSIVPTLLTGDNAASAQAVSARLAILDFRADCLPEDKLSFIADCLQRNEAVCMIGDGINDAPSLKKATVGIAMGGIGSDIAVDAADIVMVDDDVKELPHLFALSRRMMHIIKANLTFSMVLNFAALGLAVFGILNPVVGALVHNAGSVFVIVNSSFLLSWR